MPVRRYSPLSVFLLVARRGDADESDSTVNGLQTGLAVWPEAHGGGFRTKLHESAMVAFTRRPPDSGPVTGLFADGGRRYRQIIALRS